MADLEYLKHSTGSNDLLHMCCRAEQTGVVFYKNCTRQHKHLHVFTQISFLLVLVSRQTAGGAQLQHSDGQM